MPEYLNEEHRDIRRLLLEISAIYAAAAEQATISQIRATLAPAHPKQYDVEFRIYRAFTQQTRDDRARADGG